MSTRSRTNRRYWKRLAQRGRELQELHAQLKAATSEAERREILRQLAVHLESVEPMGEGDSE